MAQPQQYEREVDFTERDGDDTNHAAINSELDAAALSINQIRDNLALIQRDDGALKNGIVTAESLAPSAFDAVLVEVNVAVGEAQTAATSANNAAVSANTARDQALAAKDTAVTSASAAALNATTATTKATEAAASATASATSATNSATSATSSANSATTATTKAAEAATSATNAAASATAAAASQTAAATSATNAASSATTATTQAGIATTQAASASASATAAATSLEDFDDRYLGSKTADPTTDNDGNALLTGALYFNSVAGEMRVWAGTFWKATGSSVGGAINTAKYTATAGQTTFAIVYDVGFIHVYLNGVKLESGVEFTANNGTSVVLATGATAGDVVDMIAFGIFSVANTYTKAEADALLGAKANQATTYSKAEADALLGAKANQATTYSKAEVDTATSLSSRGLFRKAATDAPAWAKTGAGTASTASTLYVEVNGTVKTIASGTSITMPALTAGTDYAIWAKPDGTLEATSNHTSPPVANSRKVGGFHYAAGSNATGTSGGNTTPQINEYSFWDLKFKPNCADPRGMTLVGGGYWMDIYLTGVDAITNGSSKYNVTMADGSSPPKVPTMFGGNGSTTYGSYTWFEAMELATAFGKRCPTQREFMSAMYGTTEASSIGTDQGSTILNAAYTSKWGVVQSTGVLWVWGDDRGGAYNTGGWNANTEGRGSEYNAPNAVLLGGDWYDGANAGSRCSAWSNAASYSYSSVGSRFCCDHLQLD